MRQAIVGVSQAVFEVAAETLWPTRCALCDTPGAVLCDSCLRALPYVDWWRACRRCGSPFGLVQCDACNPMALARLGVSELPYAACASVVAFTGDTGQIVRVFKDQGEQRLAEVLAQVMARTVPPEWRFDELVYVPASLAAFRRRGFDHAQLLAQAVARRLDIGCLEAFERPRVRDQRGLGASERIANLSHILDVRPGCVGARRYLLVDDVMTTGSTLCAASRALLDAGALEVRCLSFARV